MKWDRKFIILYIVLNILFFLDVYFTKIGLSLGYTEGNILLRSSIGYLGVNLTLILSFIIRFVAVSYWLKAHHKTQNKIVSYYGMSLVSTFMAFIVGSWFSTIGCGLKTLV